MYSAFDLILASALSSIVSAVVCTILWRRQYDRLGDAWMADHLRLEDALEQYEDEPPLDLSPEDRLALATVRDFWKNPSHYVLIKEESPDGLRVTVRRKKEATPDASV